MKLSRLPSQVGVDDDPWVVSAEAPPESGAVHTLVDSRDGLVFISTSLAREALENPASGPESHAALRQQIKHRK